MTLGSEEDMNQKVKNVQLFPKKYFATIESVLIIYNEFEFFNVRI
jgi:hypothetical protein